MATFLAHHAGIAVTAYGYVRKGQRPLTRERRRAAMPVLLIALRLTAREATPCPVLAMTGPVGSPSRSFHLVHEQGIVIGIVGNDAPDDDDAIARGDQVVGPAPVVGPGQNLAGLEQLRDVQGGHAPVKAHGAGGFE